MSAVNQAWESFLVSVGARFNDGLISGFDDSEYDGTAKNAELMTPLTNLGVVTVTGADAGAFLQAHLTNDVAAIVPGVVQLSGYCSPKGRLLSLFHMTAFNDGYMLIMPNDVIEPMIKRLQMFANMARPAGGKALFSKVEKTDVSLTDASDELAVVGLIGTATLSGLSGWLEGQADSNSGASVNSLSALGYSLQAGQVVTMGIGQHQEVLVVAPISQLLELWTHLSDDVKISAAPTASWMLAMIRAGIPQVVSATSDKFVPQMVNLHLLDGVSFSKGCYPGQEIVARMQYLGKLKRRMHRLSSDKNSVQVGDGLHTEADADAGTVVAVALSPPEASNGCEILAVLKVSAEDSELFSNSEGSLPLKVLKLPYPLAGDSAHNL